MLNAEYQGYILHKRYYFLLSSWAAEAIMVSGLLKHKVRNEKQLLGIPLLVVN